MAGAETIHILKFDMPLAQEAQIKIKRYEGLNDDDLSMMHLNAMPPNECKVMASQN